MTKVVNKGNKKTLQMSVLVMLCWIGVNLNNGKSLYQILNQILNTAYISKYKILVFN